MRKLFGPIGLTLLVALAWPGGTAHGRSEDMEIRAGDRVSIFSGDIHVPADQDRRGIVFCLGCDIRIEGRVKEAVVIFGGLQIDGGEVRQQVIGVFSDLELRNATVGDQLVNVLGTLETTGTAIDGQTVNISFGNWLPGLTALVFWSRVFALFAGFVMLLLLAAIVPDRIRLIGEEAPVRYVAAFFVGILVWLGALVVFSILSITIVGIPLALLGYFVLKWLGVGGIFYAIGRRIGRAFGGEMSLLGGILITFAIFAAIRLLPTPLGAWGLLLSALLWTLFFLLVEVPALGLIVLTRFGTASAGLLASAPVPHTPAAIPPGRPGESADPPAPGV